MDENLCEPYCAMRCLVKQRLSNADAFSCAIASRASCFFSPDTTGLPASWGDGPYIARNLSQDFHRQFIAVLFDAISKLWIPFPPAIVDQSRASYG